MKDMEEFDIKRQIFEHSSDMRGMGIEDPNDILEICTAGDFLIKQDFFKSANRELYLDFNSNPELAKVYFAKIPDSKKRGSFVYHAVNIGEDNERLPSGDLLTLDPSVEGKEAGTKISDNLKEYCIQAFREANPEMAKALTDKDILQGLGIEDWSYEKVVYMIGREKSFNQQIKEIASTPERKKEFFARINNPERVKAAGYTEEEAEQEKMQQDGMQPEEQEEGLTIEQAATISGIDEEILKEAFGENAKILGVKRTPDAQGLERQLGKQLNGMSSNLVMFNVANQDSPLKSKGYVCNTAGDILYEDGDGGHPNLIRDIVGTGSNGQDVNSIDDEIAKMEVESKQVDLGGKEKYYVKEGDEVGVKTYQNKAKEIIDQMRAELEKIQSATDLDKVKMLTQSGDVVNGALKQLTDLQQVCGIDEPELLQQLTEQRDKFVSDAEIARMAGMVQPDSLMGFDSRDPAYQMENRLNGEINK